MSQPKRKLPERVSSPGRVWAPDRVDPGPGRVPESREHPAPGWVAGMGRAPHPAVSLADRLHRSLWLGSCSVGGRGAALPLLGYRGSGALFSAAAAPDFTDQQAPQSMSAALQTPAALSQDVSVIRQAA